MIVGVVNIRREATVRFSVRDKQGQDHEIEAVIDTGYDGYLTLPPALIAALGLTHIGSGRTLLANGTEDQFDIYEAVVDWDGALLRLEVDSADTDPLIGMALLYGYDLHIPVIDGGTVVIQKLP
jgi:clan AA aspartic protease